MSGTPFPRAFAWRTRPPQHSRTPESPLWCVKEHIQCYDFIFGKGEQKDLLFW